jgi:hypothetical protein
MDRLFKTIIINGQTNQVPQCVRKGNLSELQITCQHLKFCNTKFDSTCIAASTSFHLPPIQVFYALHMK